jgi:putrescine aminotransferase
VALANLDLMEKEQLPQRVKDDIGPYLAKGFEAIAQHPLVGSAETCGFTAGLVLVKNKETRERFAADLSVGMVCRRHCFQNGLIMRAVGDRMIIAPPLVMTHAQIDEMLALITRCLDLTYAEVKENGWLA